MGSSRNSTLGLVTSASPMLVRLLWPPVATRETQAPIEGAGHRQDSFFCSSNVSAAQAKVLLNGAS